MFKHYIRTKRTNIGTKLYELASAEGILLDFLIYQGNVEPALVQL